MSYLGLPRLHFAGRFQADVPTVNNPAPYHNNDTFEPRFQWLQRPPDVFGYFNPAGGGAFRMRGCQITGVSYPDGRYTSSAGDDPAIGLHLAEDNHRVSAKIVDLHPLAQIVPEIYGLRVRLLDSTGTEFLRGNYAPAAVADQWRRDQSTAPIPDLGGIYQSVLTDVWWPDDLSSPLLRALRSATSDGQLSIKFNLGGLGVDPNDPQAFFGDIFGTIGAYHTGEPRQFVAARRLWKAPGSPLNDAPCLLDEDTRMVFVDLGNSVPTTVRTGPYIPLGAVRLAVLAADGTTQVLAPLTGLDGDYHADRAAIAAVTLTADQVAVARQGRLAVVDGSEPPKRLLAETADTVYARADTFVFRVHPGTDDNQAGTTVHATRYGQPAAGVQVLITGGRTNPPLHYPATFTTGADGTAEITLSSDPPIGSKPGIDGVVFPLPYTLAGIPPQPKLGSLLVRVFDTFDAPANPTWVRDVQPIFQRYANLFPAMRRVFDMGNYHHVLKYSDTIRAALLLDRTAPDHMPVTRDLTPRKRDMIVKWLDTAPHPPVLNIDSPDALRTVLQQAMLVELATIPPYLTALFTIKADRNTEVADIIGGVVRQEMLHLALAGNLLNAVGGTPQIGRPGLVPTYPGRLPGPVLPDLIVRLRRCSIEQVRDVFMAIELPQHPTVDGRKFTGKVIDHSKISVSGRGKVQKADATEMSRLRDWFDKAEYEPMTIGWFYNQIARAVTRLSREAAAKGQTLFTGDPARQVSWPTAPGTLYTVTDTQSALLAIYEIIEQGEGSPQNLDDDPDPELLGHYYRFEQIVKGRKLIRNRAGAWVFEGDPVPFDPDGVYPMVDDPDAYRFESGSVPRREAELANEMYTNLLTSLQQVFNGGTNALSDAVSLMFTLKIQAMKLFDLPTAPGAATVAGPAFQSPGVVLG